MPPIDDEARDLTGLRVTWTSFGVGEMAIEWVTALPLDQFGDGAFDVRLSIDHRVVLQLDWPDLFHLRAAIDRLAGAHRRERRTWAEFEDDPLDCDPPSPPPWADFDPPGLPRSWGAPPTPPPPRPARWGQPWTGQDDADLARALANGETPASLAERLGRTRAGVEARLAKLGLPKPGAAPAAPSAP